MPKTYGACGTEGCTDCLPLFDEANQEITPERPTLKEEAERLLGYWEQHGGNPEAVAKWAITDMLGILRYITEDEA